MTDTIWLIRKTLLNTFRNYKNVLMYIVLPILGIVLSMLINGGAGDAALKIGIVNQDGDEAVTRDAALFVSGLAHMEATETSEAEASELVASGKLDAAVIFPQGFADGLKKGEPEAVRIAAVKDSQVAPYVTMYLNPYVGNLASIGQAASGDDAAFDALYAGYREADFRYEASEVEDLATDYSTANRSMGYLIVFMMFSAISLSGIMIKERENRTYYRIQSTPVSARAYVISNVIVNIVMLMIQSAVTLLVMVWLFKIDTGIPLWQMLVYLLLFALVAVSLSLVIVAFSSSSMFANTLQSTLIIPTCLLAGCMFPIELMPETFHLIADFLPQHWLLDAFGKLQQGEGIAGIVRNLSTLLAFALTLTLIAIYKFGRNKDTRSYY
ncbi:ABC transporter permease [Paenibacillus arenilitoris]|uniref:Transport permease protein n=1 Tax=Paenibacillus arenilitoris TaxID=2772299 RepID=A0A927CQK1_9BACL|nr:ABC transporter permease [Paenibacillus arenilitoris]MBD2871267.1 ABC transporter permease [Paenibacillus arenilitoris]